MPTRGFRRGDGSESSVPGWWDSPEPTVPEPDHQPRADDAVNTAPEPPAPPHLAATETREDTSIRDDTTICTPISARRADPPTDPTPPRAVSIDRPSLPGAVVAVAAPAALVLPRPFVWPVSESSTALAEQDPRQLPPPAKDPAPPQRSKPSRWRRRREQPDLTRRSLTRATSVERSLASWEPVSVTEACGFATRFAADYLSWDELEPTRRPAALRQYLADPGMADVGWSGRGRQRAEWATAGRTVELAGGGVVVVEVTTRVVLYHRTEHATEDVWRPPVGEATPSLAVAPSSAPPTTVRGWEPGAAWWVRIAPPVRRDHDGRLVIDLGLDLSAAQS
jgi:hypothetical protein